MKNPYELLRSKKIIAILDGDTSFGEFPVNDTTEQIKVSMPHLSGPQLCEMSNKFGLAVSYNWGGGSRSRWEYLDSLMEYCIKNERFSELLSCMFDKAQFVDKLRGLSAQGIEDAHRKIIEETLNHINGELCFGGNELCVVGSKFIVRAIGAVSTIEAPTINVIDRHYIKDLYDRALKDIDDGNTDSAFTKSRTIVEETFCYAIEKANEIPSDKGDIGKLYGQVKTLYNLGQKQDKEQWANQLLSGLEKILDAITQFRNKQGDAHGAGMKRQVIPERYARLVLNSAFTMAEFVLAVMLNKHNSNT
jgi:hypothetical protein